MAPYKITILGIKTEEVTKEVGDINNNDMLTADGRSPPRAV